MCQDAKAFITAFQVCAHGKSFHQPLADHLNPIETPRCPWSHIAVDFVTGLTISDRNNAILIVADNISKGVQYIPLKKKKKNSLPQQRLGIFWSDLSFISMISLQILCQTDDPNSHPKSGEISALHLEPW